jgi:general stress protein YciG
MSRQNRPSPSVKDSELYEKLRDEGNSKQKAARIANQAAATSRREVGRKGGHALPYEEWTTRALRQKARDVGIEGGSKMSKSELINKLRCS